MAYGNLLQFLAAMYQKQLNQLSQSQPGSRSRSLFPVFRIHVFKLRTLMHAVPVCRWAAQLALPSVLPCFKRKTDMDRILPLARIIRGCLAVLACCAPSGRFFPPRPRSAAQQEEKPSECFFSTDRQQGSNPLLELMFRPKCTTPEVFLWVKNPAPGRQDPAFLLVA